MVNQKTHECIEFIIDIAAAYPQAFTDAWNECRYISGLIKDIEDFDGTDALNDEIMSILWEYGGDESIQNLVDAIQGLVWFPDHYMLLFEDIETITILSNLGHEPSKLLEPACRALHIVHKECGQRLLPKFMHK